MPFFARPQSAAVRIVDPATHDEFRPQRKDAIQRQCRNIMIYGYCKFQDKGCIYYHPKSQESSATADPPGASSTGTLSAQAINAPVFVPKSGTPVPASPPQSKASAAQASPTPASPESTGTYEFPEGYSFSAGDTSVASIIDQMQTLDTQFYDESQYNPYQQDYDAAASYSYSAAPVFLRQPLNYHLYTPAIPAPFTTSATGSHFIPPSNDLRQTLQSRSEITRQVAPMGTELPDELQGYHTLVPLENISSSNERRKFLTWYSIVYRAIRTSDGLPYTLRRVENFRLTQQSAQSAFASIDAWSKIRHPSIVSVHEAFTTRAFNDSSLVVCYTYHPSARTLFDVHLKAKVAAFQSQAAQQLHQPGSSSTQGFGLQSQRLVSGFSFAGGNTAGTGLVSGVGAGSGGQPMIPERVIWTYVVQISSAIKQVHEARLAVRTIDATKILVTGQNRVRIGSCGLIDVLMHDTPQDISLLQQEDLLMFGRLLYALCCSTLAVTNGASFQKSLDTIGRQYSQDLKNAILFLMSKAGLHRTIDQLLDMVRGKVLVDLNDALLATDRLENELLSELENARLVRLLCKFGFINERPEFACDPRWSETGDRYIIKLFRDYVFHQVDENGNPVLNLSHVFTCLNKLDAGTEEKIMLVARDEQSCLVVSYKDIKQCIESAFFELARSSSSAKQRSGYR
ncbi:hypothetical protein AX14_009189 [Amanita brunnescens Koide BX004]|nr:hypothetical protein AX14_009189 [Amanita brunnescens Koide BX004]